MDQKNVCREGDRWHVVGDLVICRIPGWVTGNTFCVVETQSPPGGGPPMHIHSREDEVFCVLQGEYEIVVAGRVLSLQSGEVAFAPRRITHWYRNVGSTVGRLLVTLIPAGFENFFREVDSLGDAGPEPVERLAARYGLTLFQENTA